ncbi:carboxylesterase [Culex quinquefasciatus]|uniref:carboxylesterase n=1 Tax=Culex quinquefasciatus TaxID=7176 RepID=B0XAZ3_CULQU|nr:carboxylesterase [Culex quinquefasciatus]|eukprot:XP_001866815.1 carboxylesterase [Culex quinquefasciatus]
MATAHLQAWTDRKPWVAEVLRINYFRRDTFSSIMQSVTSTKNGTDTGTLTTRTSEWQKTPIFGIEILNGQLFPVLVFIHEGSFTIGSATFGGVELLMESKIIVVTMDYRLDVLGFLRYPKLNISGNYGL